MYRLTLNCYWRLADVITFLDNCRNVFNIPPSMTKLWIVYVYPLGPFTCCFTGCGTLCDSCRLTCGSCQLGLRWCGWRWLGRTSNIITAQNSDLVVEAKSQRARLVLVSTCESVGQITLHNLPHLVYGHVWELLGSAFDLTRLITY